MKIGKYIYKSYILFLVLIIFCKNPACATNNNYTPIISDANVVNFLSNPSGAPFYQFGTKDSAQNSMDSPSIIALTGQNYKYAAVYHTYTCVKIPPRAGGGCQNEYLINLAVSNDLRTWTWVRTLFSNADMPKIVAVSGSTWVMVVHEQWMGAGSTAPCQVAYELFYNFSDLLAGTIRSTWIAPQYQSQLNGTPSVYNASLAQNSDGYYVVDGQYGFHYNLNGRDLNAVTTIKNLFDPNNPIPNFSSQPSTADMYNNDFTYYGVLGNIGQRDTLQTTTSRFNIQEGNSATNNPSTNFADWGIYLYKFGDSYSYPSGVGSIQKLNISTPSSSTSFGNPSVNILPSPTGSGYVMFISYYLFCQGTTQNCQGTSPTEAGSLTYYYNIH